MLVAIGLLVLAIVLLLVLLVRKRRVQAAQAAAAEEAAAPAAAPAEVVTVDFTRPGQALRLRGSFSRGLRDLRRHLGRGARYRLPWYLMVGETSSGKSELLGRAGLNLPLGEPPETTPDEGAGCNFWFLDGGVVLDVAGDFLLRSGSRGNDAGWKQLLHLLRAERPERPLDGLLLAVSAAGLLADGQAAVTGKADEICRKLRDAQRELGMNFPIYVLVTGCDRVPGFASLFREVPESAEGEIFGWSSPYGLEAPFRTEWVDEAFQTVGASLKKIQLNILGERIQIDEPDGVFLFPAEVQGLRDPLRVLLSQIFRASTFTEPLVLRGLYFCGELRGEAIESKAAPDLLAMGWQSAWRDASRRVLFLRDLLERKVFPERGLARFASRNLTGRSRLVRIAQVALVVLALVTGLGIWWAHSRLAKREPSLRAFLLQTSRDLAETRERRAAGEDLTEAYLEERTLRFLGRTGLAGIDASAYRSIFLPSSWFSAFNRGFKQSITIGYNEVVFNALSMELQHRASDLIHKGRPVRLQEALPLTDDLADLAGVGSAVGGGAEAGQPGVFEGVEEGEDERFVNEDVDDTAAITFAAPEILAVEGTPEVLALREYTARLTELSRKARSYNNLRETRDLHELADLVQYLFGAAMPPGFFEHAGTYQKALRSVVYKPFDSNVYQADASLTATLLADQIFERLYHGNALVFYLKTLQDELDQIGTAAAGNISKSRLLRELSVAAEQTEQVLARSELAWTASPTFALGKPFEKDLEAVHGCELLGPTVEQEIRQKGEAATLALQQELAAYQTVYTGPLLRRDAPGKPWKLSPNVLELRNALLGLLNESFMHLRSRRTLQVDVARGTRLTWDTRQLQEAVQLYEPYKAFVEGGLRRFPPSLRDPLQQSARNRLSARLMEQVAEAQRFSAVVGSDTFLEREIQAEVDNFRAAGQPLSDLISIFDRIDSPADHELLQRVTLAQAQGLLRSVDRLLESESLYVPKGGDFDWWDGGRTVAFEAFGVDDAEELAAYLEAQRARLAQIAEQYADPALRVLAGSSRDSELRKLVNKWNAIVAELRKHDAKKPGNSVAALEEWIGQLPQLDTRSCMKTLAPKRLDERPPDWFLQVRAGLRRELFVRCQELAGGQARSGYQEIASVFNQRLAGRFPFSRELPGPHDREADPADLRAFFKVFDAQAPALEALAEGDPRFGDQEDEIRLFLERMRKVRALFGPFLEDPKRPEVPSFDFEVDFRTNTKTGHEKGGNQIIRWELTAGDDRLVRWSAPVLGARWSLGEPVRLALQWAKDAEDMPLPPPGKAAEPRMKVEGRTVSYTYTGRWSLFSFLRERAGEETDFEGGDDPHPQTLRFAIDTGPAPAAGQDEDEENDKNKPATPERTGQVKVFVRVTLMAIEKKDKEETRKEIELPDFPARAPVPSAQMAGGEEAGAQGKTR